MSQIKVKQVRGTAGQCKKNRLVLRGLGLRGIGRERVHKDNNCIRGMINKVSHLVKYELLG